MRIWRIEDSSGFGPFTTDTLSEGEKIASLDYDLPPPDFDPGIPYDAFKPGVHLIGCHSLKQLYAWIKDIDLLESRGFKLSEWEVGRNEYHIGEYQTIFQQEDAKRRAIHELKIIKAYGPDI